MDCQENEYWDQWGRCVTCQQCGPGQELSKDCGYGEGRDAYCMTCPPRRYKNNWGHHRCQSCITCAVINRVQKANCTATSNAICGECLPRFYQKTRIGGLQDQECIPCTKQTPTSEVQWSHNAAWTHGAWIHGDPPTLSLPIAGITGALQLSLVKADVPTVPPQEAILIALVSGLLVVFTLTFVGLFFLYCKKFFSRHCQHVTGGSLQFETDEATDESVFPMPPGQETNPEYPLSESIFENKPLNPILDDDCNSTHTFHTHKSFPMVSCASESHLHWVHTPIECTELDLQKFSNCASYTVVETLMGNADENSGDRLELNVPFQVPSP